MGVSGINASNDMMMAMMKMLMQSMQQTSEMATDMIAVGVENSMAGQKMATAQNIIDVYA